MIGVSITRFSCGKALPGNPIKCAARVKHDPRIVAALCAGAALFAIQNFAFAGGEYALIRSTIDCGGGRVTGAGYTVSGTVGQPDAGDLSGSTYVVRGGFWTSLHQPGAVNDPLPVDPATYNDRLKNRYISFKPNNFAGETAKVVITLVDSFPHPGLIGNSWWVQEPVAPSNPLLPANECVAVLGSQAMAADIDWEASGCEVLHVTGCPIEPTSEYEVRAASGAAVSAPLSVSTALKPVHEPIQEKFWGDAVGHFDPGAGTWTPPNGLTNIDDAIAVLKTWRDGPVVAPIWDVVHLSVADVAPGNVNMVVNYNDVRTILQAFNNDPYPFGPAGLDGMCADDTGIPGQGAEIRFYPIRTAPLGSPAGTVGTSVTPNFNAGFGCWEISVPAGIEVDLDVQAFNWENAPGSPVLGVIQATVQPAGYSNGVGAPLNPKGWPDDPGNGAYQAYSVCGPPELGGDGSPCTGPFDSTCNNKTNGFCIRNTDWVMHNCAQDLPMTATPTLAYGWATAAVADWTQNESCEPEDASARTMGGLILEVPQDATGTYLIALDPDSNNTFMTTFAGRPITDLTLTPACISIIPPPEPPIPAPPPHDILKIRYVSIDPRGADLSNIGKDLDIRVTLTDTLVTGVTAVGSFWWAGAPDADCISIVGPTQPAMPPNWDACPTLHLTGCPLMPTSTYGIVAVAGGAESTSLSMETQALPVGGKWWGDCVGSFDPGIPGWTPPQGIVNIDDAVAAIRTFQDEGAFNATHVSVTDVHPAGFPQQPFGVPNKQVDINDVFAILQGFQGAEFPGPDLDQCPD